MLQVKDLRKKKKTRGQSSGPPFNPNLGKAEADYEFQASPV